MALTYIFLFFFQDLIWQKSLFFGREVVQTTNLPSDQAASLWLKLHRKFGFMHYTWEFVLKLNCELDSNSFHVQRCAEGLRRCIKEIYFYKQLLTFSSTVSSALMQFECNLFGYEGFGSGSEIMSDLRTFLKILILSCGFTDKKKHNPLKILVKLALSCCD